MLRSFEGKSSERAKRHSREEGEEETERNLFPEAVGGKRERARSGS